MSGEANAVHSDLLPEDRARADQYALLARLFYRGPDEALLAAISESAIHDQAESSVAGDVTQAWAAVVSAASRADCIAVQQEYDRVFIGTGMAAVTPYASFYLGDTGREKVLVRLRDDLASFGLARNETAAEPEDHFAGLFDVMRHLVLAGSDDASLARQQQFFARYIERAYPLFCDAAICCEAASFYSLVARFAKTFLFVDASAMLMV